MAIWGMSSVTGAQDDVMDDSNPISCFTLSRTERLYGFGICTAFLIGPMRQLKTMFAPVRMVASIVYIVLLILTLIIAFTLKSLLLCLILCIVQFLALFWYSASYIPYGRAAIKKVVGGCIEV
ncbi:hypothetical protein BGZ73_000259 [Actinomortierella ambigua]|nr:hypothetical protein BGZ73_000259 [Actinomortierella ambigua]